MTGQYPSKTRDGIRFHEKVDEWASRLRVQPAEVRLRPMTTKWASCSSRGMISFSTRLLAKSDSFQEGVIVHELLHLKIPNHGKLFKSLMRAYLPKVPLDIGAAPD